MSDNKYPVVTNPSADVEESEWTCNTHHLLYVQLIDLGEPYKSIHEEELDTDFLYMPGTSWAALYRRIAKIKKITNDVIKQLPEDFYKGNTSLLYKKTFVKKYYRVLADEVAKEGRRTRKKVFSTDPIFNDKNLKVLITRAGG